MQSSFSQQRSPCLRPQPTGVAPPHSSTVARPTSTRNILKLTTVALLYNVRTSVLNIVAGTLSNATTLHQACQATACRWMNESQGSSGTDCSQKFAQSLEQDLSDFLRIAHCRVKRISSAKGEWHVDFEVPASAKNATLSARLEALETADDDWLVHSGSIYFTTQTDGTLTVCGDERTSSNDNSDAETSARDGSDKQPGPADRPGASVASGGAGASPSGDGYPHWVVLSLALALAVCSMVIIVLSVIVLRSRLAGASSPKSASAAATSSGSGHDSPPRPTAVESSVIFEEDPATEVFSEDWVQPLVEKDVTLIDC